MADLMTVEDRIINVLANKVDPVLSKHFGGATLSSFEDGIAYVKLTGACAQCPSAQETVEGVVRDFVTGGVPEVKDVKLDASVSDDLLDFAKKILRGEETVD
ncbi:MAG: NifU family protein [Clostridiales bacterium]|nr:NifU family protein [Clostridiales bacterium]MDD7034832.1 NifU family protein [Bacillota bacterium]MDY2919766.1 NifU family protein [Lentihominibacter sp.]